MRQLALLPLGIPAQAMQLHTQVLQMCRTRQAQVSAVPFGALTAQYLRRAGVLRLGVSTAFELASLQDSADRALRTLETEQGDGYAVCAAISDYGDRIVGRRLARDPAPEPQ